MIEPSPSLHIRMFVRAGICPPVNNRSLHRKLPYDALGAASLLVRLNNFFTLYILDNFHTSEYECKFIIVAFHA